MESATAGSTTRIFFVSSATDSIASVTPEEVGADGEIDLVVGIGGFEQRFGDVRLALVVLLQDHDLAAVEHHGAVGQVLEAHHQPGLGLLGISLERPGLAVDERDFEVRGLRGRRG